MPRFDPDKGGSFAAVIKEEIKKVNQVLARLKKLGAQVEKATKALRKEKKSKKGTRKGGR
jgi:hypothetical protein